MAELPSTVALPQPLVEPAAAAAAGRSFERRPPARGSHGCRRIAFVAEPAVVQRLLELTRRHRLGRRELVCSLLRGVPLPAPVVPRCAPSPVDAQTARLLMQLRDGLWGALAALASDDASLHPSRRPASPGTAREHLERQLGELVPLLESLARWLLDAARHG